MENLPIVQRTFAASLADPLDAVNKLGQAFADSKMFGCSNVSQGRVLAMHCLCEGKSPVAVVREYHLIGGQLSMKADVMLAKFRQAGGEHTIIERTPDRAEIELKWKRHRVRFSLSWDEIKTESYVFCKDQKTLKENWSTPRRRMQMLWARLISDAIRATAPECMAGAYTPEDLGVHSDDLDGQAEQDADADAPAQEVTAVEVAPAAIEAAPADVQSQAIDTAAESDATPAEVGFRGSRVDAQPEMVQDQQLIDMKQLKDQLGYGPVVWQRVLERFGVPSAKYLTFADADKILFWMTRKLQELEKKTN